MRGWLLQDGGYDPGSYWEVSWVGGGSGVAGRGESVRAAAAQQLQAGRGACPPRAAHHLVCLLAHTARLACGVIPPLPAITPTRPHTVQVVTRDASPAAGADPACVPNSQRLFPLIISLIESGKEASWRQVEQGLRICPGAINSSGDATMCECGVGAWAGDGCAAAVEAASAPALALCAALPPGPLPLLCLCLCLQGP